MKLYYLTVLATIISLGTISTHAAPQHGIGTYGTIKYAANFKNFDYVNPLAPKGGDFNTADMGTFDSLNPFIVIGTPAASVMVTFATLLAPAFDEVSGHYAYVAESVDVAEDKSFVIFNLNPKAAFDNGEAITADDVVFSFETLRDKGNPLFRGYYKSVSRVEKLGSHCVKFHISDIENKELPSILGQLPVLSKKFFNVHDFSKTLVTPAPSSGPYRIVKTDFGRRIVLERVKKWWGENIPSQKGQYNFDKINVDYYRDGTAMFEAFKAGKSDFRVENSAKQWVSGYDFDAFTKGHVKKELIAHGNPQPTQGFAFNLRRPIFKDWRVRKAISNMFDFSWINKNLFSGQYNRNESFFPNSPFAQTGLPDGAELTLLQSYAGQIRNDILTKRIVPPIHANGAETRDIRKKSLALLADAGWHLINGKLTHAETKQHFVINFIGADPAMEKVILGFKRNLAELGIELNVRTLDVGSYIERVHEYDYDLVSIILGQSISLGNEQRAYWGSKAADLKGGQNYSGLKDPVVDNLCEKIAEAPDFQTLTTAAKALDRVLMGSYIMIPHWYRDKIPCAYWNRFGKMNDNPIYYPLPYTMAWWVDSTKDKVIQTLRGSLVGHDSAQKSTGACTRFLAWVKGLFPSKG
ncbi:MAG: extracellular solute-binding protein [Candidatus Paracaedibacteraceae bacterium]|nr:extracellular solute-binding protein [Candidatus Paracaedibacteraceae bacterium]